MTLRTKSKSRQWTVWLCAALVLLAVYVILSRILFNSVTWDLFAPRLHRLAIPLLAFFFYVAWHVRWDGVRREKKVKEKAQVQDEAEKVEAVGEVEGEDEGEGEGEVEGGSEGEEWNLPKGVAEPLVQHESDATHRVESATGEDLFTQARALPHGVVPDFEFDGPYLELLGKSAAAGYAPALAKLGDYAMRRAAWVEAYYWMKQAQRSGMHGLSPTLREIRKNWSQCGFPNQSSNVNKLFTHEAGSIGRALLHVDSGHEAAKAKEFLKANHPEFLAGVIFA